MGSTIIVDDGEGGHVAVNVTNETGAVAGHVLSDSGFGLPSARVTVWGADQGATTNETGWFQISSVPPGKKAIRAEHPNYRPAESEIEIAAGKALKVTITLVPAIDGQAGDRPHLHDYWAGRMSVQIIDNDFVFHRPKYPGPIGTAMTYYTLASQALLQSPCVSGGKGEIMSTQTSAFGFSDPAQIVWAGTGNISLTVTWTAMDYPGGSKVGIIWREPNNASFHWGPAITSGQRFAIPVGPAGWDSSHQPFSLWEFYLCVAGKDETRIIGQTHQGRAFTGKYHVLATLERSYPIFPEPPHPRFWANGSAVRVIDAWRNVTCDLSSTFCSDPIISGRAWTPYFGWSPAVGTIIPPGVTQLRIQINWKADISANAKPLSISWSPATVPPAGKVDISNYKAAAPISRGPTDRVYEVPIVAGESDGFYQQRSNWRFLWNVEGDEANPQYVHGCACSIQLHLVVDAIRQGG